MKFAIRFGLRFCVCGSDISNYAITESACMGCRRKASPMKTCADCGCEFQELNARRCDPCRHANYVYRRYASGQMSAISAVAKARRIGQLSPPTDFACADCGKPATEYDHRDYNKPLDVAPVCRGCNRRRGYAISKNWSHEEFLTWFENLVSDKPRWVGGSLENFDCANSEQMRRKFLPEKLQINGAKP